jgi:hypothetical protein
MEKFQWVVGRKFTSEDDFRHLADQLPSGEAITETML